MGGPGLPSCFNALNRLMPALRAETARRLVKAGIQQDRIAEHLGVSQAMVSKYLRKPPNGGLASPALLDELVQNSVRLALDDETKGRVSAWCPVCTSLSERGLARASIPLEGVRECLRHEGAPEDHASANVLANLQEAEARLRRVRFAPLMPQVRSNLAMALPDAKNTRDVASFPGRLLDLRGEVKAAAEPEFGSSTHLAHVLLKVRRSQPHVRGILNVRYDETIRRAARSADLRVRVLQRVRNELVFAIPSTTQLDAVADPGDFGVEPALYLLGETAADAVQKASRLLIFLKNGEPQ